MHTPKIEKLLTPYNFTSGNSTDRIKYIVIHYVGALGGAEANCRYYAGKYIGASAHFFVGFNGEIWQGVEEKDIAWHCGAKSYVHPECRNSNSIGIEMCVRNEGSQSADSKDWYFEDATVQATVELTKYLMQKYGVDAGHVLRHKDVTGKTCPNPYVYNHTVHTWDAFQAAIKETGNADPEEEKGKLTKITGKAVATADQMAGFLKKKNPAVAQCVIDMIPVYLEEGEAENIRGDVAFAQSCLETGYFTFRGSAVKPGQNNFSGLGVTKNGETGNAFPSARTGIRAQVQHLKAYANTAKLKQECVDLRFKYVTRGCAPYVEHLGIQENPKGKGWAAGADYGGKILKLLNEILSGEETADTQEKPVREESKQDKPMQEELVHAAEIVTGGYLVTTTVDSLRIRKGPGTSYPVTGGINEGSGHKKKYTIVEEKNGWGRLQSGAGWIYLWHTRRAV